MLHPGVFLAFEPVELFKLITSVIILNFIVNGAGDGHAFAITHDKLLIFHKVDLIQVDHAVAVTADKIGVGQEQLGKIFKGHISLDSSRFGININIMVGVVGINDVAD